MHPHRPHAQNRSRNRGLSLIESLMAVAIAAVATGATLPGFREALELRRLEGAAAQLHTDLQLARSEAVTRNQSLRISYRTGASDSCYVIHTGGAGACACDAHGQPVCTAGAEALRVEHFAGGRVQLNSNVSSMVLDAAKGTVSPTGTVRLRGAEGRALHVVVNIMGRARKCSPGATVPGYAPC